MASLLGIVTATTNRARAATCIESWVKMAEGAVWTHVVENGQAGDYLGVVPAFRQGVDWMLTETSASVICCLHDDLEVTERGWDLRVLELFTQHPEVGLAGFGGAIGLGSDDLYKAPYRPEQLARIGFRSNMLDAEKHGARSLVTQPVVCLDGFSQIGRRQFWEGCRKIGPHCEGLSVDPSPRPWTVLEQLGVIHHFYDGMLGCLARRYGWQVAYLPVGCIHYGGQTAVGDAGYQEWAKTKTTEGDHGFWEQAHRIGYEAFRDVLPLRL